MPEKFNEKDLERACDDLAMLPYFPSESRQSVMRLLALMCPHKEALLWVVAEAVSRAPKWPGPTELRGLLCTRYDAADGKDQPFCSIPGFTPSEMEAKYLAKHEERKMLGAAQDREALALLRDGGK